MTTKPDITAITYDLAKRCERRAHQHLLAAADETTGTSDINHALEYFKQADMLRFYGSKMQGSPDA
jgi:hypothetical protein